MLKIIMRVFILILFFIYTSFSYADFIKIDNNGNKLDISSKKWHCVLDRKTNLMWEVKTTDHTLHNQHNTYTWFDGKTGTKNGGNSKNCNWGKFCNTSKYVSLINSQKLCSFSNWRLPSVVELTTIIKYTDFDPTIDTVFFPNAIPSLYWSSEENIDDKEAAWDVPFFYGGEGGSGKEFNSYIRLVRNAD